MKSFFIALVMVMTAGLVCAEEDQARGDGLFSNGSFLSEAISSTVDKLNKVASGDEKIVSDDAKGIGADTLEYDGNPLGRPNAAFTRDDLRSRRERMNRMGE
jgi:hypothetical protein